MFWALSRGIIDRGPCEGVKPPSAEVERDRYSYDKIIRLLILTGQRRDEMAGLRWSEIDLEAATWTLPKERSKNRREHVIPLAPLSLEMLSSLPRFDGSPFVFGGGRAAPSAFSKIKSRLDAAVANLNGNSPIPHWTLHDLRRTVATRMAELQIAPHVVEAVLNHQSGVIRGVAAIYNRWSYLPEKRAALEAWASTLIERTKHL